MSSIPPEVRFLNRASFGILPEDLERVHQLGIPAYLDEQLDPDTIDDSALEDFIAERYPTVFYTPMQIFAMPREERRRVPRELKLATLTRMIYSRRQLQEVMVDFWSNHFNIFHNDGPLRFLKTVDDREVIRRHALGSFRDLLHASARSPVMLYYLDNHVNTVAGPNENYARELLELHSLGVDGGYTETDVREVARAFTGWGIDRGRFAGTFRFYPERHDDGAKTVLGLHLAPGGGIGDGEQVLDHLLAQPVTARFIAHKLCTRLVADDPPASLVAAVAAAFGADGDIPAMLRALLLSPAFQAAVDTKLRRPLEFLVGSLRVTAADIQRAGVRVMAKLLRDLGQTPFGWPAPDGYPEDLQYWASTSGLLSRWNFAMGLAGGRLPGIQPAWPAIPGNDPETLVTTLAARLLHRPLEDSRRQVLVQMAGALPAARAVPAVTGLLLASPDFQYR